MNKKVILMLMLVTIVVLIITHFIRMFHFVPLNAKRTVDGLIDMDYPFVYTKENSTWSEWDYLKDEFPKLQFNKSIDNYTFSYHETVTPYPMRVTTTEIDFNKTDLNLLYGSLPTSKDEVVLTTTMAHDIYEQIYRYINYCADNNVELDENTQKFLNMSSIRHLIDTNPFIAQNYFGIDSAIEYQVDAKVVGIVHEQFLGDSIFVLEGYFDNKDLSTYNSRYLIDVENSQQFIKLIETQWLVNYTVSQKNDQVTHSIDGIPFTVIFDPDNELPPREKVNYYNLYWVPALVPLAYLFFKLRKHLSHSPDYTPTIITKEPLANWDKIDDLEL